MKALSILIPTFNDKCLELVKALNRQCEKICSTKSEILNSYEIVVADDGSTDKATVDENSKINNLPNCIYVIKGVNTGRAAIRNFLASKAKYDTLLFIDSDMTVIRNDFIVKYLTYRDKASVIYGGYEVPEQETMADNLRYRYERACQNAHTAEKRKQHPYNDFHTSNFLIERSVMLRITFDEKYNHYGYEDVAFGIALKEAGISILHIDNPMGFCRFESNEDFIVKTEEGIRTLVEHSDEIGKYSRLIKYIYYLKKLHISNIVRCILHPLNSCMRRNLIIKNISLEILNIYKISYILEYMNSINRL